MADPLEIAKLAVYLASDDSAYVVGADFLIDGGVTAISGVGACASLQRVQAVPVPAQARDGSRRRLARLVTPWSLRVRCGNSYSANILIPRSNQHDSNRLLTPSKVARWAGHAQCPLMALSSTCAVPEASQA